MVFPAFLETNHLDTWPQVGCSPHHESWQLEIVQELGIFSRFFPTMVWGINVGINIGLDSFRAKHMIFEQLLLGYMSM